jgi:hypothetical protein
VNCAQSAIMRHAWKEWRDAQRRGWNKLASVDRWDWPRCLRFAAAQRRERQKSFAAVEQAMKEALVASGASHM